VEVQGYPAKLCPASGVVADAIYRMITLQVLEDLKQMGRQPDGKLVEP